MLIQVNLTAVSVSTRSSIQNDRVIFLFKAVTCLLQPIKLTAIILHAIYCLQNFMIGSTVLVQLSHKKLDLL